MISFGRINARLFHQPLRKLSPATNITRLSGYLETAKRSGRYLLDEIATEQREKCRERNATPQKRL